MSRAQDRRQFLQIAAASGMAVLVRAAEVRGANAKRIRLAAAASDLFRVRMEMEIEGNAHLARDPVMSRELDRKLPLKATSVIDFEERLTLNSSKVPMAARRYYYEAKSGVTIAGADVQSELRRDAKRVIARASNGPEVIYSEAAFLTHDELDLLLTPVCSLSINNLLPTEPVAPGDKWTLNDTALAKVFNFDAVQKSTMQGEIAAMDTSSVKMRLQGRLDAAVDGVPTAMDVAGKLTFDLASQSITWLALAVREQREIGLSKPGFEISATIKLIRQSLDKPNAVRETEAIDLTAAIPRHRMLVKVASEATGFDAFMDRPWRVISDATGLTTLRMIVNDKAIAQCDVRPLPDMKPGEQLTLEAFQNEIERSLGKQFGELIESEEGLNGGGLRTLRVAVVGHVQEVPVQWVFLHFSDDSGRRLGATFSLESSRVETFAGSDAQLANSLHFQAIAPPRQATGKDTGNVR